MKDLARIFATYVDLDAYLEQERSKDPSSSMRAMAARQILNGQAYFLLCWGQLENEINECCSAAIRRRRESVDWAVRRGWDLYNPDNLRSSGLTFEDRVRLVLDAKGGRGGPFAMTIMHYGVRNQIAHGTLHLTRIDVSVFVQDCYLIRSALHRAA